MTTFTLDRQQAQGFRNEGRIDPLTRQPFREGQQVVACRRCAMVWLTDSWEARGACGACHETHTATRLPIPRRPAPSQSQPTPSAPPGRGFNVHQIRTAEATPRPGLSPSPAPSPQNPPSLRFPPPRRAPRLTWSDIFPDRWQRQMQARLESLAQRLRFLPNVGPVIGLFVGAFGQVPDLTLGGVIVGALLGLFAGFLAGVLLLGLVVLFRALVAVVAQILRQTPPLLRRRLVLSPPRRRRLAIIAGAALGILVLNFVLS